MLAPVQPDELDAVIAYLGVFEGLLQPKNRSASHKFIYFSVKHKPFFFSHPNLLERIISNKIIQFKNTSGIIACNNSAGIKKSPILARNGWALVQLGMDFKLLDLALDSVMLMFNQY